MQFEKQLLEHSSDAPSYRGQEEDALSLLAVRPDLLAGPEIPSVNCDRPRSVAAILCRQILKDFALHGASMYGVCWPRYEERGWRDHERNSLSDWSLEPAHQTSRAVAKAQRTSRRMRCIELPEQREYVMTQDADLDEFTTIDPAKRSAPPWVARMLSMLAKPWLVLRGTANANDLGRS